MSRCGLRCTNVSSSTGCMCTASKHVHPTARARKPPLHAAPIFGTVSGTVLGTLAYQLLLISYPYFNPCLVPEGGFLILRNTGLLSISGRRRLHKHRHSNGSTSPGVRQNHTPRGTGCVRHSMLTRRARTPDKRHSLLVAPC